MAIVNAQLKLTNVDILDPNALNPAPFEGTVPEGKAYAITNILVCNNSLTNAASFDMHLVPRGVTISDNVTIVVKELNLPPGETFTFDSERIVLEEGDRITLIAQPQSAEPGALVGDTSLAATVSYLEV